MVSKSSSSVSKFCPLPFMQCECVGAWDWNVCLTDDVKVSRNVNLVTDGLSAQ